MEEQEVEADGAANPIGLSEPKRGGKKGTKNAQSQDDKKNANGKRGRPRVDGQDESAVEVRGSQAHKRQHGTQGGADSS